MTTRRKNSPNLWPLAALVLLATSGVLLLGATADTAPRPRYPQEDMGADSLPARKKAQLEAARQFKIFHDFRFVERPASTCGWVTMTMAAPSRSLTSTVMDSTTFTS